MRSLNDSKFDCLERLARDPAAELPERLTAALTALDEMRREQGSPPLEQPVKIKKTHKQSASEFLFGAWLLGFPLYLSLAFSTYWIAATHFGVLLGFTLAMRKTRVTP